MTRAFASPEAFKQSLEQRLRSARAGSDLERQRQLLVFDRFLARLAIELGDAVTLKGGLALEMRVACARATRDVDLRMVGSSDGALLALQAAGLLDLGDSMMFEVSTDSVHPTIRGDGVRYDGVRVRAECRLAGKPYGQPFGVDVAFGDPMVREADIVIADDTLAFAGIAPPVLRIVPAETHVAEKLHAYTMPRARPNTRVKDLPDLALLASAPGLDVNGVGSALEQTFAFRATHVLPASVPSPPPAWATPYAKIAADAELPWRTLDDVTAAVRAFLDPILAGLAIRARRERSLA